MVVEELFLRLIEFVSQEVIIEIVAACFGHVFLFHQRVLLCKLENILLCLVAEVKRPVLILRVVVEVAIISAKSFGLVVTHDAVWEW
jgi:hypothetical protein